ncbi:MAG: CAP domain-containing protein [Planctomycetota bacterium]|nr:CAP domain-containing protein [Planctomycetota bacterium]
MTTPQGEAPSVNTVVDATTSYRTEAGLAALTAYAYLDQAATMHAGYQCLEEDASGGANSLSITHGESNSNNPMFISDSFFERINVAFSGDPASWPPGVNVASEVIATSAGADAVGLWWNSVYHRLPLMRHETVRAGYGDRASARGMNPNVQATGGGNRDYGTMEFGGVSAARTVSFWPEDGSTIGFLSFNTDSEGPDPLDDVDGDSSPNAAPNRGAIGVPIHLIFPTAAKFTNLAVQFGAQGQANSPVIVLVKDADLLTNAGDASFYSDSMLSHGEVFILPDMPSLASGTTYAVSVTVNAGPTYAWSFSTP